MLENVQVHQWLTGNLDFLTAENGTSDQRRLAEKSWGRALVGTDKTMWTGALGQRLIQEIFPDGWPPAKKDGHVPDWETPEYIIEVKTETYFTEGTAGEKILGVPIKYRNVPALYGKPLLIVCFGWAERTLVFSNPPDKNLAEILDFWRARNITYVKGSGLLPPWSEPPDFSSESPAEPELPSREEIPDSPIPCLNST